MNQEHFNTTKINELKNMLGDDFQDLVDTFIAETEEQLNALQIAFDNQQQEEAKRLAHTIKGSSANMGASFLSELSQQLENEIKMNSHSLEEEYKKLAIEFGNVVAGLRNK